MPFKIFYGASYRPGAINQLQSIVECNPQYTFQTASYTSLSTYTLPAKTKRPRAVKRLEKLFGFIPKLPIYAEIPDLIDLIDKIKQFEPDLVIVDHDPLVSNVATYLNLPLWYCSPLHLIDGISWRKERVDYFQAFQKTWKQLYYLPPASQNLIYSPFGDINHHLTLKPGFRWVQPYFQFKKNTPTDNILQVEKPRQRAIKHLLDSIDIEVNTQWNIAKAKWVLTSGQTHYLKDILYHQVPFAIAPDLKNPETLINAFICRLLNLGQDLGQIELLEQYGQQPLQQAYQQAQTYQIQPQQISLSTLLQQFFQNKVSCQV